MKITNNQITTPSIVLVVILVLATGIAHLIVKIVRCRCIVHDPVTIQNVTCRSKPVNRTYSLTNLYANITRVLYNVMVNFEIFRRTDVKYRPYLVNITEDYCAFFAQNKASTYLRIVKSIYLPYTNLNHTCPYFGEVFIKNMPLTMDKLPSIIPTGEYRLDVTCFDPRGKLITMQFFSEIRESIDKDRG